MNPLAREESLAVTVPRSVLPIVIDLFCRIGFSILYGLELNRGFLEAMYFILYPLIALSLFVLRDRWIDRRRKQRLRVWMNDPSIPAFSIREGERGLIYPILFLSIIHFVAFGYFIENNSPVFFGLLLHTVYLSATLLIFSRAVFRQTNIRQAQADQTDRYDDPSADDNNERIITLESKLKSVQQRLEGYVLESALLGGLAFSAFLQILSQNIITVADLQQFGHRISELFKLLVTADTERLPPLLLQLSGHQDLFCLISAQSLICSIFFLLVIASRMRYSDLSDQIQHYLALAHDANQKEDELFAQAEQLSERNQQRLALFSEKVQDAMLQSQKLFELLVPVVTFIRLFRNLGVATFYVVVISSALFIGNWLTIFCAALLLGMMLYFRRKAILQFWGQCLPILKNELDHRRMKYITGGIVFAFAGLWVGYVGYRWSGVSMITVGLLILFLTRLLFLVLTSPDPAFIPPPEGTDNHLNRLRFLRMISVVAEACLLFGFVSGFMGNDENAFTLLGFLLISIYMIGYCLQLPFRWGARVLLVISIFSANTGFLFKVLQLPTANEWLMIGLTLLAFVGIVLLKQFKPFGFGRWLLLFFCFGSALGGLFLLVRLPGANTMKTMGLVCGWLSFLGMLYYAKGKVGYKLLLAVAISSWFAGTLIDLLQWVSWYLGMLLQITALVLYLVVESYWQESGFQFRRDWIVRFVIFLSLMPPFFGMNKPFAYVAYRIQYPHTLLRTYEDYDRLREQIHLHERLEHPLAYIQTINQNIPYWENLAENNEGYDKHWHFHDIREAIERVNDMPRYDIEHHFNTGKDSLFYYRQGLVWARCAVNYYPYWDEIQVFLEQSERAGYPNPDEVEYWCDYALRQLNPGTGEKRQVAKHRANCRK